MLHWDTKEYKEVMMELANEDVVDLVSEGMKNFGFDLLF
jgi:hypothetical protein